MLAGLVASLLLLLVLAASVRSVPPNHAYVVEQFGRYRRTLRPGVRFLIPFVESIHAKVDLGEQVRTIAPEPAITSDDLVACVSTVLYFRVEDPIAASYEIGDRERAMAMLTVTCLRTLLGELEFDRAQASLHEITARLTGMLRQQARSWGIDVLRVEITAFETGSR